MGNTKKEITIVAIVIAILLLVMFALASHKKAYGQEIGYGYKLIVIDTAIADTVAEVVISQPNANGAIDYVILQYLYSDRNREVRLKNIRINGMKIGDGPYIGIGQQRLTLPKPTERGQWKLSYLKYAPEIEVEIMPITTPKQKPRLYY